MASRALAVVRLLVVARILGEVGKGEYGVYQQALVLMNWVVPLVMFGLGDVVERYAARFEREGRLGWWVRRQVVRLLVAGLMAAGVMVAATPWVVRRVFHLESGGWGLVGTCVVVIVLLSAYQYVAAVLRGLRAYEAAAGMEVTSAVLLLGLSVAAALRGQAVGLVYMYGVSLAVPVMYWGSLVWRHVKGMDEAGGREARLSRFGRWALVRLLLMMSFGFLSVWGVGHLAARAGLETQEVRAQQAEYAVPYRVAEILAYVAVTAWGSTYGIAAKWWAHGQTRRARAELFRVGRFGTAGLAILAAGAVLCRGLIGWVLPAYGEAVAMLLPPLLGVFVWYGVLAFCTTYADLREMPHRGAWLWGAAVAGQWVVMLFGGEGAGMNGPGPKEAVVAASAAGLGMAVLVLAPLVLWWPWKLTATGVPMAVVAVSAVSLFVPGNVVGVLGPVVLVGAVAGLQAGGLLVRRSDRRRWRRWREGAGT
jgi:hypothetical protein